MERLLGWLRILRGLEEPRLCFLEVAGDGHLPQALLAGVHEDEKVPAARLGDRRGHEGRERIVMELLVDDDPHGDAVPAHHGQQERVLPRQPLLPQGELRGEREAGEFFGDRHPRRVAGAGAGREDGGEGQGGDPHPSRQWPWKEAGKGVHGGTSG